MDKRKVKYTGSIYHCERDGKEVIERRENFHENLPSRAPLIWWWGGRLKEFGQGAENHG
jgi:hypothetical protein